MVHNIYADTYRHHRQQNPLPPYRKGCKPSNMRFCSQYKTMILSQKKIMSQKVGSLQQILTNMHTQLTGIHKATTRTELLPRVPIRQEYQQQKHHHNSKNMTSNSIQVSHPKWRNIHRLITSAQKSDMQVKPYTENALRLLETQGYKLTLVCYAQGLSYHEI